MTLPPYRPKRFLANLAQVFCGLWLLAAVWYFWQWYSMRGVSYVLFTGLGIVGLALLVAAALMRRATPDERAYLASVRRSLIPILVACLIVIGAFTRTYLFAAERAEIRTLQQPGMRVFLDELKYSRWSDYQDYLRNLPEEGKL